MTLYDALKGLDVSDDNAWTADGLPRVEVVSRLIGEPITRGDLSKAFPGFTRTSPVLAIQAEPDPAMQATSTPPPLEKVDDRFVAKSREEATIHELLIGYDQRIQVLRDSIAAQNVELTNTIQAREVHAAKLNTQSGQQMADEDQAARMRYIAKQNEIRASRAEIAKQINFPAIAKLVGKSPLDQAMARKTARGGNRPEPFNMNKPTSEHG